MDAGAPLPRVNTDTQELVLSYHVAGDFDAPRAKVLFRLVKAHYLGWPNGEVVQAHPLFSRGLSLYGFFEVLNSSWRNSLMVANRAHRQHPDQDFHPYRHFIVTFHDETFECLAKEFEIAS